MEIKPVFNYNLSHLCLLKSNLNNLLNTQNTTQKDTIIMFDFHCDIIPMPFIIQEKFNLKMAITVLKYR